MGTDFRGLQMAVVAVEIDSCSALAFIERKASGVQAGTKPDIDLLGPLIFLQQLHDSNRPRRFVTVDSSGKIKAPRTNTFFAVSDQLRAVGDCETIPVPAVVQCSPLDIFQHGLNIDFLTEIAADVF